MRGPSLVVVRAVVRVMGNFQLRVMGQVQLRFRVMVDSPS